MAAPGRRFPLLPRKKNSDKSHFGHVLVVAGSRRMTGAAVLAATAALRSGAGLTTVSSPEGVADVLRKKLPPEIMFLPLPETRSGSLSARAVLPLLKYASERRVNACVVGPGLSTDPETGRVVRTLVGRLRAPAVLDADGLNAFKGHAAELQKTKASLVLTPHAGEFARLFGARVPEKSGGRRALAERTARQLEVVLVLKGSRSVVAAPDRVFVNSTGNAGLAKGGSGDVLCGILGAFLAQGLPPFEAAAWAVHLHGKAADHAVKKTGVLGLTASDVIACLPNALR